MDPPSKLSTEALHTTTPSARSGTMHIYRREMDLPSQSSTEAFHTTTLPIYRDRKIKEMDPPVNQSQRPCIPLHPLRDLVQCIYIEGR